MGVVEAGRSPRSSSAQPDTINASGTINIAITYRIPAMTIAGMLWMSSGRAPAEARRRLRRMRQALDGAATLWRYVVGLRGFLRTPLDLDAARRQIAYAIETRPEQLLSIVGRAVYDRPQSPYLRLLEHAGVERADFEALVGEEGVEGAFARLYDAGVYVTVDELKGKRPIRRGSLSLDVTPRDFDNPLLVKQYEAST